MRSQAHQKLVRRVRTERKAVVRELRRDAEFLARVQLKETVARYALVLMCIVSALHCSQLNCLSW